jgi:hypothetical protein
MITWEYHCTQMIQKIFGRFGASNCYFIVFIVLRLKFQLDDTIIKSIETAPNNELKKAKEIIQRIRRRELYKVV